MTDAESFQPDEPASATPLDESASPTAAATSELGEPAEPNATAEAAEPVVSQRAALNARGVELCPWCDGDGERWRTSKERVPCAPCAGSGEADRWQGSEADAWRARKTHPPRIPLAPNSRVIVTAADEPTPEPTKRHAHRGRCRPGRPCWTDKAVETGAR